MEGGGLAEFFGARVHCTACNQRNAIHSSWLEETTAVHRVLTERIQEGVDIELALRVPCVCHLLRGVDGDDDKAGENPDDGHSHEQFHEGEAPLRSSLRQGYGRQGSYGGLAGAGAGRVHDYSFWSL